MKGAFTAKASIRIHAEAERVWDALTNPKLIKLYLFGTDVSSEWKVGSPDHEDNYNTVTYELAEIGGETMLTISQDNNPTQDAADHSGVNWASVLKTLKELLESQQF